MGGICFRSRLFLAALGPARARRICAASLFARPRTGRPGVFCSCEGGSCLVIYHARACIWKKEPGRPSPGRAERRGAARAARPRRAGLKGRCARERKQSFPRLINLRAIRTAPVATSTAPSVHHPSPLAYPCPISKTYPRPKTLPYNPSHQFIWQTAGRDPNVPWMGGGGAVLVERRAWQTP